MAFTEPTSTPTSLLPVRISKVLEDVMGLTCTFTSSDCSCKRMALLSCLLCWEHYRADLYTKPHFLQDGQTAHQTQPLKMSC